MPFLGSTFLQLTKPFGKAVCVRRIARLFFEAETNKIYVRSALVLEIWKEEIKMEEIISALKVVRKYSQKNLVKELNFSKGTVEQSNKRIRKSLPLCCTFNL